MLPNVTLTYWFSLLVLIGVSIDVSMAQTLNYAWSTTVGGPEQDRGTAVNTDLNGNVLVAGTFTDSTDLDPGGGVSMHLSVGMEDVFIQKFDSNGTLLWARSFGGESSEYPHAIASDAAGNVYVVGNFYNTVDFDPDTNTYNLTSNGINDFYLLKLNSAGNFVSASSFGSTGFDEARDIHIDANDNKYLIGNFSETVDFDPGNTNYNLTSAGEDDCFILKLNASDDFVWVSQFSSAYMVQGYSLALDSFGGVLCCGIFGGQCDFDPGNGNYNLTAAGYWDMFVAKIDTLGIFHWARSFGGSGSTELIRDITTDADGNVYSIGNFSNTSGIDFDPGSGVYNLASTGQNQYFIQKLNSNGDFDWALVMGGEIGYSIAYHSSGKIYSAVRFHSSIDADPGSGTATLTAIGNYEDGYIHILDTAGSYVWAGRIGGGGIDYIMSIHVDPLGQVYATGLYQGVADFDPFSSVSYKSSNGAEDAFVLKLGYCTTKYTSISVEACDSFEFSSGVILTSSGTYVDTLTNSQGCDSVVTLNLVLNHTAQQQQWVTTCDSFISPSGNIIWTESGSYFDTLNTIGGCDSIINVNLTVLQLDTSISQTDSTLVSNDTTSSHQWISCDSMLIINGETAQSFTPANSGFYAVILSNQGCSDTSACFYFNLLGTKQLVKPLFVVYPNPSRDRIIISTPINSSLISGVIYNSSGQAVHRFQSSTTGMQEVSISGLAPGFYFLEISVNGHPTQNTPLIVSGS